MSSFFQDLALSLTALAGAVCPEGVRLFRVVDSDLYEAVVSGGKTVEQRNVGPNVQVDTPAIYLAGDKSDRRFVYCVATDKTSLLCFRHTDEDDWEPVALQSATSTPAKLAEGSRLSGCILSESESNDTHIIIFEDSNAAGHLQVLRVEHSLSEAGGAEEEDEDEDGPVAWWSKVELGPANTVHLHHGGAYFTQSTDGGAITVLYVCTDGEIHRLMNNGGGEWRDDGLPGTRPPQGLHIANFWARFSEDEGSGEALDVIALAEPGEEGEAKLVHTDPGGCQKVIGIVDRQGRFASLDKEENVPVALSMLKKAGKKMFGKKK